MNIRANIDKSQFTANFAQYLSIKNRRESDRYFSTHVYPYLVIIISYVTHTWYFESVAEYEDMEGELLKHIYNKKLKGSLSGYKGNWYNVVFTIFNNRFMDLKRAEKVRKARKDTLDSIKPYLPSTIEQEHDLD